MNEIEFEKFKKNLATAIKDSGNIINKALDEEFELGYNTKLVNLLNILKNKSDLETNSDINKMGIICNGNPEIMLNLSLMAMRNSINLFLVSENYHSVNECIFALIDEVAMDMKIENKIIYSSDNTETDVSSNIDDFDKIAFIGSYFDYENFVAFCDNSQKIMFWNDNNIKILMERRELKKEYENIIKISYVSNTEVEVYDDKEEFIEEVKNGEFAIIYAHNDERDEILSKINPRIIEFDKFNISDFKFNINEFIKAIK